MYKIKTKLVVYCLVYFLAVRIPKLMCRGGTSLFVIGLKNKKTTGTLKIFTQFFTLRMCRGGTILFVIGLKIKKTTGTLKIFTQFFTLAPQLVKLYVNSILTNN